MGIKSTALGNIGNGTVNSMYSDGSCYAHGKHSITYALIKSLCGPLETNVTLYTNSIQKKFIRGVAGWFS